MDTVGTAERKDPKDFVWWAEDNLSLIIYHMYVAGGKKHSLHSILKYEVEQSRST